jgi:hypothetical protein
MRMEDLDPDRSRAEYSAAALEDLRCPASIGRKDRTSGSVCALHPSQRHDVYLPPGRSCGRAASLSQSLFAKDLAAALSAPHESTGAVQDPSRRRASFTPVPAASSDRVSANFKCR